MSKGIKTAFTRIRRSPYQAVAGISIMTMTLFLASIFFIIAAGSQAVLKFFETKPQVNAFFKQDYVPSPAEVTQLETKYTSGGKIDTFRYVTKQEALEVYKELNKNDPLLLEAVTAEMLPASIEVTAKNPSDLTPVAEDLRHEAGVEDVRFAEDIVAQLSRWTSSVRIVGIAMIGAHILITFSIIMLIIGIKVANRRDEIYTLQLLGATTGYISSPFIWEGIIYGVVGAFLAWGISYLVLLYSMGFLVSFLAGIPILPPPLTFMFGLLGIELLLGCLVGGLGGIIATRRFLKA